jgi:hypothetical protein
MIKRLAAALAVCVAFLASDSASAQTSLTDLMRQTFVDSVVLSKTPGGGGIVAHQPVFVNDERVVSVTSLIDQISTQIGSQVSIFPLGSSSGGFTYGYDSALGTYNRTTQTFGPAFAERPASIGKGKFSFGMNYVHATYKSLDDHSLDDGSIKFNLLHQPIGSFVEGDVIQAALDMRLKSDTAVFLFNYGVTDRLDVGVGIPIVHVSMDLTYHATILDFATHVSSPTTHLFANGGKTQDFTATGSASGVGDIVLRGKYSLMGTSTAGAGVGAELRVPSGKEEDMLGTGAAQFRVFFIGAGGNGKTIGHVNAGFTASGSGASNQANFVGGVEYAASPKLTVVADLLGRTLIDAGRVTDVTTPHPFQQGPSAPTEVTQLSSVALISGNVTAALATGGIKFNPTGNLLISAHVLVPLNNAGLKSGVTPVLGFEYSF